MNRKTKVLTIISIFQTFAIIALIGTIVLIRFYTNEQLRNSLPNDILKTQEAEEYTSEIEQIELTVKVGANLVWWDQDTGFETIERNSKYISEISPFWYELSFEGTIEPFSGAENKEITDFLKDNSIKITPVISNEFETEPLATIIADQQKKNQHIQEIVELADEYSGISLNYENLKASDKNNYTVFVTELAEELHKKDKTIAVHLHAKTEEPGTWNGPQAQDWQALGQVCDKLKIMAYDYHWSTSEAGAIAPPNWVEDVIKHAEKLIPNEKISLGIPLYGYDWIGEEGEGVTYNQAITIADHNDVTIQFDNSTKSNYFMYTDEETNFHEVWFEDAKSSSLKLKLAKKHELGGVDFWRLGDEDVQVWNEVEKVFAKK